MSQPGKRFCPVCALVGRREPCHHGTVTSHSEGGFGKVFLCNRQSEQPTIVKIMKADHFGQAEESYCLRACAHRNVVRQIDSSYSVDREYLVIEMEYCDRGDLFQDINKRRTNGLAHFAEDEVLSILAQLLLALHHIHSKNVLHRDIKTGNILLASTSEAEGGGGDLVVKIGDFGLAKFDDCTISDDWERTFCGTVPNIAPEMLTRRAVSGHRSTYSKAAEIWSLGVVMHEIMQLAPPFPGEPDVVLRNITQRNFTRIEPGRYSKELRELVEEGMLSLEPARRTSLHQIAQFACVKEGIQRYVQRFPADTVLATQQKDLSTTIPSAISLGIFNRMTRSMEMTPYLVSVDEQHLYLRDNGTGDVRRLDLGSIVSARPDDIEEEPEEEEEEEEEESAAGDGGRKEGKCSYGVELTYNAKAKPSKTILLYTSNPASRDELLAGIRNIS